MKVLLAALCIVFAGTAFAQNANTRASDAVKALELTPAFSGYWQGYVQPLQEAHEQFSMSAALAHCDRVEESHSLYLVKEYRQAIEAIAKLDGNETTSAASAEAQRFSNRYALYAYSKLNPVEREAWRKYSKD